MKVTKTVVNAPSRKLNVTWKQDESIIDSQTLDRSLREEYLLTKALGKMLLQKHGTRVALYTGDLDEISAWLKANTSKLYEWADDEVLMTPERVVEESLMATEGDYSESYKEHLMVNAMARHVSKKAAEEKGIRRPKLYFWFEDTDEAMMFKLTWGGL